MAWYYILEIGNYTCLIKANTIRRSQYLERERILGHLKTILVVLCGGQGTPGPDFLGRKQHFLLSWVLFSLFHHNNIIILIYQDLALVAAFRGFAGSWCRVI